VTIARPSRQLRTSGRPAHGGARGSRVARRAACGPGPLASRPASRQRHRSRVANLLYHVGPRSRPSRPGAHSVNHARAGSSSGRIPARTRAGAELSPNRTGPAADGRTRAVAGPLNGRSSARSTPIVVGRNRPGRKPSSPNSQLISASWGEKWVVVPLEPPVPVPFAAAAARSTWQQPAASLRFEDRHVADAGGRRAARGEQQVRQRQAGRAGTNDHGLHRSTAHRPTRTVALNWCHGLTRIRITLRGTSANRWRSAWRAPTADGPR
jgi:hypothetical protein